MNQREESQTSSGFERRFGCCFGGQGKHSATLLRHFHHQRLKSMNCSFKTHKFLGRKSSINNKKHALANPMQK